MTRRAVSNDMPPRDVPETIRVVGYSEDGWDGVWVRVNERLLDPQKSLLIRQHSPTGFAWGYGGSGPSQLALAILLETLGFRNATAIWPGGDAERLYMEFKWEFVAGLRGQNGPLGRFELTVPLREWVTKKLAEREEG